MGFGQGEEDIFSSMGGCEVDGVGAPGASNRVSPFKVSTNPSRTIIVGNVPSAAADEHLKALFQVRQEAFRRGLPTFKPNRICFQGDELLALCAAGIWRYSKSENRIQGSWSCCGVVLRLASSFASKEAT